MKNIWPGCLIIIVTLAVAVSCLEPYNPPVVAQNSNYLVVDAFLNTTDNSASVSLSRTIPLYSDEEVPRELNATVIIEDEAGLRFTLQQEENGLYTLSNIPVDEEQKYRVYIRTSDQQEYFSEFIEPKPTPAIDSVYWKGEKDGVQIYVDTHDDHAATGYYKWDYVETFEYNAQYGSILKVVNGDILYRSPEESIYTCWKTDKATDIHVTATAKLTSDVVSFFPLVFIETGSRKLTRTYSILVRQRAITEEEYNYWLQLRQTTQSLGGLFDPMPTQVTGNFYDGTNPTRPVLGYFSGGSIQEKRIFINFYDLPDHLQVILQSDCVIDSIPLAEIDNRKNFELLIGPYGEPFLLGYLTSIHRCIDCRSLGGITTKPDFWP
jgi:hypothetical protein